MASSAISTQGTRIYFSSGVGTAKTITSVTKAAQAVVTTSAAHGLSIGDTVDFSGVTGMPELNGVRGVVTSAPTTTTFSININSSPFDLDVRCMFALKAQLIPMWMACCSIPQGSSW